MFEKLKSYMLRQSEAPDPLADPHPGRQSLSASELPPEPPADLKALMIALSARKSQEVGAHKGESPEAIALVHRLSAACIEAGLICIYSNNSMTLTAKAHQMGLRDAHAVMDWTLFHHLPEYAHKARHLDLYAGAELRSQLWGNAIKEALQKMENSPPESWDLAIGYAGHTIEHVWYIDRTQNLKIEGAIGMYTNMASMTPSQLRAFIAAKAADPTIARDQPVEIFDPAPGLDPSAKPRLN